MASTMEIDFSKLLEVKGVDAYIILDRGCDILESHIPDNISLNLDQIQGSVRNMLQAQRGLGDLSSSLLLTEKGVVQIANMNSFYLVIIAGYNSSVDVTKLTAIADDLREALTQS